MDDADEVDVSRHLLDFCFVVRLNPPLVNALVSELIKLKSSEEGEEEEEVERTAGRDDDVSIKFTAEELLQLKCQMQMVAARIRSRSVV